MKLDFLMDNAEQAQMWRFVAQAVAIRDNMVAQQNSSNILQGVKMTSLYTQTHRSVTYANDVVSPTPTTFMSYFCVGAAVHRNIW